MELTDLGEGQLDVLALEWVLRPCCVPESLCVLLKLFNLDRVVAVVVSVDEHGWKLNLEIS